jgi:TRAP-type C4-dicarboxylate transport system substrate-binding protein
MPNMKSLIAAAGLALAALTPPAAAQETVLRFSSWLPPTYPLQTEVFVPWAEEVAEATDGRVKIEFVTGLGSPQAHFDLIRNGVADISFSVHSYNADRFPLVMGLELPFTAPDSRSASIASWRTYEKFLKDANEYRGIKVLGIWMTGPANIFTRDKKIESLEDLTGLKIRVAGGIAKDIAERLDMVPVFAPATESYEIISKGVADGIFFPTESAYNFKLAPALGHGLEIPNGLYYSGQYMLMNQAKWDQLSAEDQEILTRLGGEHLAELSAKMWDSQDIIGKKGMQEAGTEFTVADGELLANLEAQLAIFEERWLEIAAEKGIDGEAVLAYFREQIESLN